MVRVTLQALAAVLGGTQSLHTNGFDEAIALPTEEAARLALRTQQIIGFESGVTDTVDPLAGSYFVEALTNEVEAKAWEYIAKIDAMGGSVKAIEQGYIQKEIAASAYAYQQGIESKEKVIVGVNQFVAEDKNPVPVFRVDEAMEKEQVARLKAIKAGRDASKVEALLSRLEADARTETNLMPAILEACENYVSLGEIADTLRKVFGEFKG